MKWIKIDSGNLPKTGPTYLIVVQVPRKNRDTRYDYFVVQWHGEDWWVEDRNAYLNRIAGYPATHYMEITPPKEEIC